MYSINWQSPVVFECTLALPVARSEEWMTDWQSVPSVGLTNQLRPKKIKGSRSEILKSLTNVFLPKYTSKCAIFQGFPGQFTITWSGPYLSQLYSSQSHVGVSQTNNNFF